MGINFKRGAAHQAYVKMYNPFNPIELTEGNVEAVFNRCLKSDKTVKEQHVIIAHKDGRAIEEGLYVFDADVVTANRKNILYLIGQLKASHSPELKYNLAELIIKYNHTPWTESEKALQKLCYLGGLTHALSHIEITGNNYTIKTSQTDKNPTLSPRDPNFPAWWEAHKAEWVDPTIPSFEEWWAEHRAEWEK